MQTVLFSFHARRQTQASAVCRNSGLLGPIVPTGSTRTPVEAVIGPTGHLDLFVMGNDLGVWSNFWDGQWHSWFRIGDPAPSSTFNMATPVEALVGPTNHLDLFAVGNDGGVWSNFWGNE
jgi:hypothetical protein